MYNKLHLSGVTPATTPTDARAVKSQILHALARKQDSASPPFAEGVNLRSSKQAPVC